MRASATKGILLIVIIFASSNYILFAQDSELVSDLRRSIFPENRSENHIITYYGCVTPHDSLILYIRKIQPNISSAIDILKDIAIKQDEFDIPQLNDIYRQQVRFFKNEWACGLRQFPLCIDVTDQLHLLHALETTLISFELNRKYPTPQQKFEYYRKSSDLYFLKIFKQNPDFEMYLGENANTYIHSLSWDDLNHMRDSLIWIEPYYHEIYVEKGAFRGVFLDWTFITPFVKDIKDIYQNAYNLFQSKDANNTIEYKLEESFFKHYINTSDLAKLMSKE